MDYMTDQKEQKFIVYTDPKGSISVQALVRRETIWLTQAKIAELFDVQQPAVAKHLKNIFESGELKENSVHSILEYTANDNKTYKTKFYNLDAIISVGYRVNSKRATHFRRWATTVLRSYILDGYAINKNKIGENYQQFIKAVDQVKKLLPKDSLSNADTSSILELIASFADTWLSLDAYDKSELPQAGATKKQVLFTADDLVKALADLKKQLIAKGEATGLFGTERQSDTLKGIVGNVFQSFGGHAIYETVEAKAAHLLYFIVKDHPFTDGNKRSGAFSFIWFLRRAKLLDTTRITPQALTALTLLVAESNPKDKDRLVGLILLLLKK